MITKRDKELLTEWLTMNLQMTSKSNVELIVDHVDRYFQSHSAEVKDQQGDQLSLTDKANKILEDSVKIAMNQSSFGVEEVLKNIWNYESDPARYSLAEQVIFPAMTEYSSLMNSHHIENFKNMTERCNKYDEDLRAAIEESGTYKTGYKELQQLLSEKEKEIEELEFGIENFIKWLEEHRPNVAGLGAPIHILKQLLNK